MVIDFFSIYRRGREIFENLQRGHRIEEVGNHCFKTNANRNTIYQNININITLFLNKYYILELWIL